MSDQQTAQTVDEQEQIPADQIDGDGDEQSEAEDAEASSEGEDQESDEDEESEDQDKPQGKKRNRPGKLQRRLTQLERQNAELMAYLQAQAQGSGEQQRASQTQEQSDPEPRPDQFDTDEDYQRAHVRWAVKEELRQEQEQQRQREQQTRQQREQQAFSEKLATLNETGADKYEDYEDVALGNHWQPSDAMVRTIAETDNGHDVAYYLGSHPKEAQKIAQMSPYAAAAAIGRLSDKLAQPKQKQASKAPEPVKPVRGGSGSGGTTDPEKMTPDQFVEWRQKQLAAKRRR